MQQPHLGLCPCAVATIVSVVIVNSGTLGTNLSLERLIMFSFQKNVSTSVNFIIYIDYIPVFVQGGRWRWRQSGWWQQPTRHHLHCFQDIPEHCRQWQGNTQWTRLWQADDPQLPRHYRVSQAVTLSTSRGYVCASGRETVPLQVYGFLAKSLETKFSVGQGDVCAGVCLWEVFSCVTIWKEKEAVMKNLFRLCAGICANASYKPASHIQVSHLWI